MVDKQRSVIRLQTTENRDRQLSALELHIGRDRWARVCKGDDGTMAIQVLDNPNNGPWRIKAEDFARSMQGVSRLFGLDR
ncbi:MAG: hypothetical protein AB8F65_03860 [Woeseiaceae bacterium]